MKNQDWKKEFKAYFEANLLDGDDIRDCGGAMLSAEDVYDNLIAFIEQLLEEKDFIISALKSSEETLEYANEKLAEQLLKERIKLPKKKIFLEIVDEANLFYSGWNKAIAEFKKLNKIK